MEKISECSNQTNSPRKITKLIDLLKPEYYDKFESQKKQALYNLIAFSVFFILVVIVVCCYLILQQFLRPLLWAFLFGFLLFPIKRKVGILMDNWIENLKEKKQPAVLEIFFLPLNLINYFLTTLSNIVMQYWKLLSFIFFALLFTHLTFYYSIFAQKIWLLIIELCEINFQTFQTLHNYLNFYLIFSIASCHFILVCFYWNDTTKNFLVKTTPILWFTLSYKIIFYYQTIGTLISILIVLMLLIGIISSLYNSKKEIQDETDNLIYFTSSLQLFKIKIINFFLSLLPSNNDDYDLDLLSKDIETKFEDTQVESKNEEKIEKKVVDINLNKRLPVFDNPESMEIARRNLRNLKKKLSKRNSFLNDDFVKQINLSNTYLYALIWSCILAQIYIRPQILYLLPIPIFLYIIKWLFNFIKNNETFLIYLNIINNWFEIRREVFCNPFFIFFYQYLKISDQVLSKYFKKIINSLSSIVIILFVIFGTIFALIFITIQIYQESALLVELTANIIPTIDSALSNDSEFRQILPKNLINSNLAQEFLTKGYLYGRKWIQSTLRTTFDENNPESNSTHAVEKQMLEVWDRIYHVWLNYSENYTTEGVQNRSFEAYNWDKLFSAFKTLDLSLCFNLMKENFDFIFSIFESVFSVLKGNISLMVNTITLIISFLLNGSTVILNISLSLVVFLTSLFYLLASSNNIYKPMEIAVKFILLITNSEYENVHKFERAVENSITSIFTATFKISFFYGLYTWLLLTLFESRVVYIPSVLAALFGAVPFIGAYWAFLPGVLEYWLVYSLNGKALLLVVFAILPSYFVDTAIYSEIKGGGHPYLTGLAIAGGVFYYGFEGAFLGPLLLCCVCVITKFYADSET